MDRYIIRKRKGNDPSEDSGHHTAARTPPDVQTEPSTSSKLPQQSLSPDSLDPTDIGNYLDISASGNITDDIKYKLLTAPRKPEKGYIFPSSEHNKRGRVERRQVHDNHFEQYPWLVFSQVKKGLLCINCSIFVNNKMVGGKKSIIAKKLVTEPLTKFAKLTGKDGDLEAHSQLKYHVEASTNAKTFLATRRNHELVVINQLSRQRLENVKANRDRLVPIIKTIILHGKQNIPLRGHRDDGNLLENDNDSIVRNEGNFRALLRFRIDAGDSQLKQHLETTGANATYISKTTCNDLIACCETVMLSKILDEIKASRFYSIIFDETTDIAHISQLSLAARYVDGDGKLRERFLGFVDIHKDNDCSGNIDDEPQERSITGEVLGTTILRRMQSLSMSLENCVGIGCDGCSVNMSELKGAVATIKKKAINAQVAPCRSHQLNLAVSRSCKVTSVRNSLGTIEEVVSFFTASSKRFATLKSHLKHSLQSHCQTRWVERHDAVIQFTADLATVCKVLKEIECWRDRTTAAKANILLRAITNCEFIITLFILSHIMSITYPVSKILQNPSLDVAMAKAKLDSTLKVYDGMRANADSHFARIVEEAKSVMEELDVEMSVPRLTGRQRHRENCDHNDDAMTYWKRTVFIPTLDHVTSDMRERFAEENMYHLKFNILLPSQLLKHDDHDDLAHKLDECLTELPFFEDESPFVIKKRLMGEVLQYKQTSINALDDHDSVMQALSVCPRYDYPTLHTLYKIFACLPVSIATVERSFSTLRRSKTWLRSTIKEDRLNGLALLNTHPDIDCPVDDVINQFSRKNRRREFMI